MYEDPNDRYSLDSCLIKAQPAMTLDVQHLRWPRNLMAQLGLEAALTEEGLVIAGADKVREYEEVLREVQFVNRQPQDSNTHTFTLTCSELNGRFLSNEFEVRVSTFVRIF